MTLLIFYAILAIGVSFLCSLLEAGLLSLPRSHVESMAAHGSAVGRSLKQLKDEIDRPLAAILTLNTIAHTVGAAGVGAQSAVVFGSTSVGIASAVMTLAILIFSEIIPKTLGAVHAKRLAPLTNILTRCMIFITWPLLVVLEWCNRLIGYERRTHRISRMEVLATIRLGGEVGSLGEREFATIRNLLALEKVKLADVMTPRTVVFALSANMTAGDALDQHQPLRFARMPVFDPSDESHARTIGYVTRFDLYAAAADGRADHTLEQLARDVLVLPELSSVATALEKMLDKHEHIAVVVDEYGGLEGIITLEDLLETLLGQEIVDETDPVPDMQHLARRRAEDARRDKPDG